MLFEIERQHSGQDFDIESVKYSLEHILPEHPSDAWNYIEESVQEHLIYRLGNMSILETNLNREAGNAEYAVKRDIYQKSVIHLTKDVAELYDTWDERKIAARQRQLARAATSIWKITP
jgi:hypothetical protein